MQFSDYVVFVDESGDHSLLSIDPDFPVFVLVFCIFKKSDYFSTVLPALGCFKFKYWGHDLVILHSHEIRKEANRFAMLVDASLRSRFLNDLSILIDSLPFTIITAVIDKKELAYKNINPDNPYSIALQLCLEKTHTFLQHLGQDERLTHILVEQRGPKEDRDLAKSFGQIIYPSSFSFQLEFASKQLNSSGLQLADLVAYPIARHAIKPFQENRSFEVVSKKIWGSAEKSEGLELNIFPSKRKAPELTEA